MIPYVLMAVLFLAMAILAALESSFVGLRILPWFSGMVWLRVHLITLGAITQVLFGALPFVIAIRNRQDRPKTRWDIWLLLNAGILTLLIGIPLISATPIIVGGTLVFAATILLILQLAGMKSERSQSVATNTASLAGRKFYLAGLFYFLLGILIGTGMWTGWMKALHVVGNSKEVHIHANSWGLMSLVFAGLIVDLYPIWTKKTFADTRTINLIFWMMTLGAFGLIFGPWLSNTYLLVPGLLLHFAATTWLLISFVKPLWADKAAITPGLAHLFVSYFWQIMPVLMAPFVLFAVAGLPGSDIEAIAPQALIYGWVLQFGIALLPYFFAQVLKPNRQPELGGTWFSLIVVNLGGVLMWASIFIESSRGMLSGIAYLFWVIALTPVVLQLWRIVHQGLETLEPDAAVIDAQQHVTV